MHLLKASLVLGAAAPVAYAVYTDGGVIAPCDSPIYCHGDMLKQIQLARPFADSKTFVDMPARKPLANIQADFDKLAKPLANNSALHTFLKNNFDPAGGELQPANVIQFPSKPHFLERINDPVLKEFSLKVVNMWSDLTRQYVSASTCKDCPSSFLPMKRPFVIAGGRFREPYYWDTYWIIEGLIYSGGSYIELARNAIENFLDMVETYGFVPNGARSYYLNRSQPPLLALMVRKFLRHHPDKKLAERALPLLEKEYNFWMDNRSVKIERDGTTYHLNRYHVDNNQPRPESYYEDYVTANNASYYSKSGTVYPGTELSESELANLYSNLATGAESGWDYSSRWMSNPSDAIRDDYFPLRNLNTVNTIPVDLNSIMYSVEASLATLHVENKNSSGANIWCKRAVERSRNMAAVLWNDELYSYFDYNMTSAQQNIYVPLDEQDIANEYTDPNPNTPEGMKVIRSVSSYYPLWTDALPVHFGLNLKNRRRIVEPIVAQLNSAPGGIPATNVRTGQQWDSPNVWPPHMHMLATSIDSWPRNLRNRKDVNGLGDLSLRLAQRYVDSVFCTWYATGGSTSRTPKISGLPEGSNGIMFEKYTSESINSAGGGGEYDVVEGFGWTNGAFISIMHEFASDLVRPQCVSGESDSSSDSDTSSDLDTASELDMSNETPGQEGRPFLLKWALSKLRGSGNSK
ncbi:hypothetical protein BROUX41_006459 [Berkeleyomyces rouxiae]|uniref:uncharacterized protein n=1 Tax=Berkeleyomyces rouxiae TaxID=2035830 RepID=UPI003B769323